MPVDIRGKVRELLTGAPANTEGDPLDARLGRYGEIIVLPITPTKHVMAREGSYFSTTNPTPGTPIIMGAQSIAFVDTVALFVIKNTQMPGSPLAKRMYLDYLRLILSGTAPTATVSMQFALKRSTATDREPTTPANKTVLTPVNMSSSGPGSIARVIGYSATAAMTIPASAAGDPVVSRASVPTGLGITGDQYLLKFGGEDMASKTGLTAVRAVDVAAIATPAPPVIIEPGEWLVIHMWWLTSATNIPSFEYELTHWER